MMQFMSQKRLIQVFTAVTLAAVLMASTDLTSTAPANTRSSVRKSVRISLLLPATVTGGARVLVTGEVASAPRGAQIVFQWQHRKKWVSLGRASVVHGRFRMTVLIPSGQSVLRVRTIIVTGRRQLAVSVIRELTVRVSGHSVKAAGRTTIAPAGAPPTPALATPSLPGPTEPTSPGPITITAPAVTVASGSVVYVTTPEPLKSITTVESSPTGAAPGVSVSVASGQLIVDASVQANPATMTLSVSGMGCTATECERPVAIQVPVTVTTIKAPEGPLASFTTPSPDRVAAAENHDLTDELLVTMGTTEDPGARAQAEQAATAAGGIVSGGLEAAGIYQIRWSAPQNLTARRTILEAQSGVTAVSFSTVDLYAEASAGYPVAEEFDEAKWTWPYEQVHASEAWQLATGSKITVGIIDEGNVYTAHHDLNVVETIGPYSPAFHATHVAGLACAKNNTAETGGPQLGMVGMAWGCPIVSTGVDYAHNSNAAILLAMYLMAFNPRVKVVNISMALALPGNGCASKQEAAEVAERDANAKPEFERVLAGVGKNIVWTFSAGNSCLPSVESPWAANSQLPNVITVAATNSDENLASFSDYATGVDLAAPGGMSTKTSAGEPEGIFSSAINSTALGCPPRDSCSLFCIYQIIYCGTYKADMGTSMAAPVVAGIAALVREKNPQLTAGQAGECITSTARTDGSFADSRDHLPAWKQYSKPEFQYEGLPIVNAAAAVECATSQAHSGWTTTKLPFATADHAQLISMSCPSAEFCVAGYVWGSELYFSPSVSKDPTGGPSAWTTNGGMISGESVTCGSETLCVAPYGLVDNGTVGYEFSTSTNPGDSESWFSTFNPSEEWQLNRVSCAADDFCAATSGGNGIVSSNNPSGGAGAWTYTPNIDSGGDLEDISCPSQSFCAAIDNEGNVLTSTDPTGGAGTWVSAHIDNTSEPYYGSPHGLVTLSCPSSSFCAAIDNDGSLFVSNDPSNGPSAWTDETLAPSLASLSCASSSFCAVSTGDEILTSVNPTGGAAQWNAADVPDVRELSCPTNTFCAGIDGAESVVTYNGPGGG